ncbi:phospholipid-translocating ATPase rsb1 [Pseudogymnoascus australis]
MEAIVTFNGTILEDPELCTIATCSLEYAYFEYIPNLIGNIIFLAIFGVLVVPQLFFGIKFKTWGYMAGMLVGLLLEIMGYVGRVQIHFNPFKFNNFLLYLICLTLGPAFLTASIYLCLARIVVMYGEGASRIKPRTYTLIFISCDFLSLILQGAGGALTAAADEPVARQKGVNIMIAGLIFQVVSLTAFMVLCIDFAFRLRRYPNKVNSATTSVRSTFKWKAFLFCLAIATITIFVRSIFRAAELQQGFDGALANNEITFMILEGAMIVIACICLTLFHPGVAFGGKWDQANFKFRALKQQGQEQTTGPAFEMTNDGRRAGRETAYESDNSVKDIYNPV